MPQLLLTTKFAQLGVKSSEHSTNNPLDHCAQCWQLTFKHLNISELEPLNNRACMCQAHGTSEYLMGCDASVTVGWRKGNFSQCQAGY